MKRMVLFSGGLKSLFLAELAKREGEAVLCYIALQCNLIEKAQVQQLAQELQLPLTIIELVESPPLKETLLRVLYLALHALPAAKELQCKCIYHGLSRDDDPHIGSVIDPFMKQLDDLIQLGQPLYDGKGFWLGNVSIETPLRRLDRPRVIRLGNEWRLLWARTRSCEATGIGLRHCGKCFGCCRRRNAFKKEGREDPTLYRE